MDLGSHVSGISHEIARRCMHFQQIDHIPKLLVTCTVWNKPYTPFKFQECDCASISSSWIIYPSLGSIEVAPEEGSVYHDHP